MVCSDSLSNQSLKKAGQAAIHHVSQAEAGAQRGDSWDPCLLLRGDILYSATGEGTRVLLAGAVEPWLSPLSYGPAARQ